MSTASLALYENTPANERRVGWLRHTEYCFGDLNLPYVLHDHFSGTFHFISTARIEREVGS